MVVNVVIVFVVIARVVSIPLSVIKDFGASASAAAEAAPSLLLIQYKY
jgi:hypothetical protein